MLISHGEIFECLTCGIGHSNNLQVHVIQKKGSCAVLKPFLTFRTHVSNLSDFHDLTFVFFFFLAFQKNKEVHVKKEKSHFCKIKVGGYNWGCYHIFTLYILQFNIDQLGRLVIWCIKPLYCLTPCLLSSSDHLISWIFTCWPGYCTTQYCLIGCGAWWVGPAAVVVDIAPCLPLIIYGIPSQTYRLHMQGGSWKLLVDWKTLRAVVARNWNSDTLYFTGISAVQFNNFLSCLCFFLRPL